MALTHSRKDLDYVIISDAGKLFEIDECPTQSGSTLLVVSIDILMEQVRGLQFKCLELSARHTEGVKSVWFSINSEKGQLLNEDAALASLIRTHLKKLSQPELEVQTCRAAALINHNLEKYAPELLVSI